MVMDDVSSPFEEESTDMLVLDTNETSSHSSVEAVGNVRKTGQQQFQAFAKEQLVNKLALTDDVIHHNNPNWFGCAAKKVSKCKQQWTYLKYDLGLSHRFTSLVRLEMESRSFMTTKIRLHLHLSQMAVNSTDG